MAGKTISTGTLSLKFMQNAHRAKQMKEVELDRAEVQDDGKWEVSQAVRDAWGLAKDTASQSSDVHEESYLPFLFSDKGSVSSDNNDSHNTFKNGRRVFNKKGEEVSQTSSTETALPAVVAPPSTSASSSTGRKVHPRPISISASGTSGYLRGFDQLKKPKDSKTARQAVFESGGVGVDLRSQARKDAPSSSTTFLKPAGVDDPNDSQSMPAAASPSVSKNIINGARQKKVKREREVAADAPSETRAKPKKKKKNPE